MNTHRLLSLLILLTMLLGACGPATPPPTEGPQPTVPPQATLPPPPTATPQATLAPFPAPRLLAYRPAPGEEQSLDAPIELTFDQPMDRASVEAAIAISPPVAGELTWRDDRTLALAPSTALQRGASYRVTVADTARNAEGKALEEPTAFTFGTVGYLEVSEVQPPPGADEINPDTTITIVFNRPVVPLTAIGEQGSLPSPVTLTPPIRGHGEWLNSAIYLFRPEETLLPGTRYEARIAAGLTDTTGGVLPADYTWSFTTVRPAVLQVAPWDGFAYAGPREPITITFNQPMDHASVEGLFRLEGPRGEVVAGTYRWSGGERPAAPESVAFVPATPLSRGATYRATLPAGALNASQGLAITAPATTQFTVVREPGLIETRPYDGQQGWSVYDSASLLFNSPMDTQVFTAHLSFSPPVTVSYVYWDKHNTQAYIYFQKRPATAYTMVVDGRAPDKYGALLGQTTTIRFTTGDLYPHAELNTTGRLAAISAYTNTVVYASHRNVSRLDLSLYRLSTEEFMRLNGFGDWNAWWNYRPNRADLLWTWSRAVEAPRNEMMLERFELTDAAGAPLPPGLYYVQLTAPESPPASEVSRFMFIRSRYNLVLKQARDELLVWATDLASGQPVADVPLYFHRKGGGSAVTGRTDAQGLYQPPTWRTDDLWEAVFVTSGRPGDDDFAIAYNNWSDGISPWDFNIDYDYWSYDYVGYAYTDRPIYRPGQTVYFKGILRADDDAHYTLPTAVKTLEVQISDPDGRELYRQELPVSDMGTLDGALLLDEEAALGTYFVYMRSPTINAYASTSFAVAEYRKPEFQVAVVTDRDAYLSGDDIAVTAEATYYFGGPVADAGVRWNVLSANYFFAYQCPPGTTCPWYNWNDIDWDALYGMETYPAGQLIASGEGQTDADGRITFRVPADVTRQGASQTYTIEASVTDINDQEVSNRTTTVVHQGEFYVGLAPRGYVGEAGRERVVDLLTVDWDSQPVAGVPLTVIFYEHNWYSVRRQQDGYYYWDWTSQDIPVYTTTVTTGASGKTTVAFTPSKAGLYRVRASGYDSRAHEIRSSTYLWTWGGTGYVSWRQDSNNRINLVADKKEYQVGDVAEILIPSPYSGTVQALVTIERGHLIHTEVRELVGNSSVLHIPITEEYVPNVFVSVVIVQGSNLAADGIASFKMGLIKLPVAIERKQLRITLTPDRDMAGGQYYGPRETATYDLLVTDSEGRPVEAEFSLRLADLAVLALADEREPSLEAVFWRERGLGVKTSAPLVVSLEQYNRELAPGKKGGGGGYDERFAGIVRSQFADTAFWAPAVRTDAAGRAQVQVTLPDNLTTWRMQARGITAETLVGRVDVDILSTLDLLVRPVLPRFFVVGDRAEIGTVVNNNTGESLEVQVRLTVQGLELAGPAVQTVQVPGGGRVRVDWPVTVPAGEQVVVRMEATAGDYGDAREDKLPVYRYSTPEVVATAGRLSEAGFRQEVVQLPPVYDPTQGELTVQVDGSLTAATQDALAYLKHYPYECVEQTVSRFLPNVLTYQALQELGLGDTDLEQNLTELVSVALQRLYAAQHYDGGWGWWASDRSNAYLTAYVLHGMLEARRAGFVVDGDAMGRAAAFLRLNLPGVGRLETNWQANRLAYMLYVLAEHGAMMDLPTQGDLGTAVALFEKRHLLDHYGRATLALALGLLEPNEPARVQTLLADLAGAAIVSATGTHWEEARPDYWNMNTDTRTTAIVLWASARLDPQSERLPNVVRWLMAMRKQGHWSTTQDTAWSLLGLVAYMRASGELAGDFSYSVYLNGAVLGQGDVSPANIVESVRLQVEIAQLLQDEANRLVVEREAPEAGQTGAGQLYYAAYLRYFMPADQVKALNRGIMVARQYSPVNAPGQPITSAQVGDVVQVKVTVVAPTDLYYVVVEDPLPAGCEGVDVTLKTTSVVGQSPELQNLSAQQQDYWYRWYGWGWWWFSHTEMRDEKVVLFATYLPRGTYEYTYLMRASVPGEFLVMPSHAYQMYFPEVFGRSDGANFTVTR